MLRPHSSNAFALVVAFALIVGTSLLTVPRCVVAQTTSTQTAFVRATTATISPSTVFGTTLRITLGEVLERAGADNLLIKESEARYTLALANEMRTGAWFMPSFYAGAGVYGASGTVMNARGEFFQNVSPNNASIVGGIVGEWRFADAVYATKAAAYRSEAAREDIAAQRNRTLFSAVGAYFDIAAAQERMRLLGETTTLNERLLTQIELQQGAGLSYKSDVLLVKSSLSRLRVLSQQAAAEVYRRSAELSAALNIEEPHLIIASDSAFFPIPLNDTLALEALTKEALLLRPELRSFQNEVAALREEATAFSTGRLLPSVTLNLSTTLLGSVPAPEFGRAASTLGITWSAPLADMLGRGQAQQVETLLGLRKAQTEVLANQIEREVGAFIGALAMLRPALEYAREGMSAAREALEQSIGRQKLGTAKPFEVLQAYDYVTRAQGDYVQIVSEYNKAEYGLFLARGRTINKK
ncbi:MAG: TolC family protein [Candidatus Kapaibacteriota bacterium]